MRNFAGLLKPVVCTIKQVASNIYVHVISFTNLNFIVGFFKVVKRCLSVNVNSALEVIKLLLL